MRPTWGVLAHDVSIARPLRKTCTDRRDATGNHLGLRPADAGRTWPVTMWRHDIGRLSHLPRRSNRKIAKSGKSQSRWAKRSSLPLSLSRLTTMACRRVTVGRLSCILVVGGTRPDDYGVGDTIRDRPRSPQSDGWHSSERYPRSRWKRRCGLKGNGLQPASAGQGIRRDRLAAVGTALHSVAAPLDPAGRLAGGRRCRRCPRSISFRPFPNR